MRKLMLLLVSPVFFISCESEQIPVTSAEQQTVENFTIKKNNELQSDILIDSKSDLTFTQIEKYLLDSKPYLDGRSACNIINNNPISSSAKTIGGYYDPFSGHSCGSSGWSPCLTKLMQRTTIDEVNDHYSATAYGNSEFKGFQSEFFFLSDVINTSGIDPYISATKANAVYREVACRVLDYIDGHLTLPNDEWYYITPTTIEIDRFLSPSGAAGIYILFEFNLYRGYP